MTRAVVLVSWDGKRPALSCVTVDALPDFDIVVFDYSGGESTPVAPLPVNVTLSHRTECKGQIYKHFARFLSARSLDADYVALIDDDIEVSISALNGALAMGRENRLDSFSLSLTPDSHINHRRFVQQAGTDLRPMDWVEVMMPFYTRELYLAAEPYYRHSVSSYGIDQFVMPTTGKLTGATHVAIIDRFGARHARPVTSNARVYSNGMTALQERVAIRRACIRHVQATAPALVGTAWYYRTFAPLNGPARFWALRFAWPWHQLRRIASRRNRPTLDRRTAEQFS